MDEIIYLESDEEITSVIDKLKQSKSLKVALVVPREATILQSVVNLKLLAKEATNLGKEISLVTSDKIGRNLASQIGLVVYDSIRDRRPVYHPPALNPKAEEVIEINLAEEQEAEPPKPKGVEVHHFQESSLRYKKPQETPIATSWPKQKIKREIHWGKLNKIIWPALAIVAILLIIFGYLLLPKVKVMLKVEAINYQKDLSLAVSSNANTEDYDNKVFPGTLIDLTKEKEQKFTATGKKNLGGKATGTLTLYNYWDSSTQGLEKGTKFSSSSKTFVGKNSITIPGTSIRGGNIVPGTASVEIEAENPGEDYNVKAGRFTIVGLTALQQEKIYGQSSKDLTGGFSKEVTVVSQSDYDKAKEQLIKDVSAELNDELKAKSEGMEILEKAINNENVETKSSANVDAEANDFTLIIKQRMRVIVFPRESFNLFVLGILEKQIPYDKMISLGPDGNINAITIEPKYDQNQINLQVQVNAKISSRVNLDKVKKDILGKSRRAAEEYINNLSGVSGFDIQYSPSFWFKRIPNYSRSLIVKLEYTDQSKENSPGSEVSPVISPAISPIVSPIISPSTEAIQ